MTTVALSTSVIQRGKSGVATYVFGLLEGFRRLGWPVKFHLLGFDEDRPLFEPWLGACEWVGVGESWRPAVKNILWHHTRLAAATAGADVLHIPSYRRIVWRPPCPQVVTIHDCAPFRLAGKYDFLRMFYGRRVIVPLARRVEGVMTVSETTAADIEKFFAIPRDQITVTLNGIDHERFHPDAAAASLRHLKLPEGLRQGWWIYVARLEHPAKNHLRLIEAFEGLCARAGELAGQLVLAGADWHGAETIRERVAASPVRERVFLTGFVAAEDLPGWYAGARALVFPSLFEGFGLPPLEAMACGCPVVSSTSGSLREIVADAALTVDPESPESISSAMSSLTADPALSARLSAAGLRRADDFRWEKTAAATLAVYRLAAAKALTQKRARLGTK